MQSIRDLLQQLGIDPRKSLGQNFCVDKRLSESVVEALQTQPDDTIWEIGPGLGALTRRLAKQGNPLWCFEMDERLRPHLHETLAPFSQTHVIWGDFLEVDHTPAVPTSGTLIICGNLPYSSGTAMVRRLLEAPPARFRRGVFLLQREVTRKACARPGSDDYSFLSVAVGLYAHSRVGATFSPASFFPNPQVWSSLLLLEPLPLTTEERQRRQRALSLASTAFEQRRKMTVNLLKKRHTVIHRPWEDVFATLRLDAGVRAENLSHETYLALADNLA